jgi:hypothetical protein
MAYHKIDAESVNSITSALDFFTVPPTNVSISAAKTFEILTSNPLSDRPFHFKIFSSDNYIDLSKCYLLTEWRMRKKGPAGTPVDLVDTDNVATIQLFGNTFIKNVRMSIGGREVYNSNSLQAYKSYMTHELSYSPTAKKSHLNAAGYHYCDKGALLEDDDGYKGRKALFNKSRVAQFMAKLDLDICNQSLLLINHCEVDVEITPCDGPFMLMAPGWDKQTEYQMDLLAMKLYVKKVSLTDGLALDIARKLETKPARYALRRTMMKSVFVPEGHYQFNANLFLDQIPRRVVLGLVSNGDFIGDITRSPFNFQAFDVREISITANGRSHPQAPYQLGPGKLTRPFNDMNDAIGFSGSLEGNGITLKQYGKTHCFYVFNLTNSGDDQAGMFDLIQMGSTAVEIKFNKATPASGLMLIVMAEADMLFMIDRNRTIATDVTI